jgi:U4/U6.U5 tri-snRNP-associated protein 2
MYFKVIFLLLCMFMLMLFNLGMSYLPGFVGLNNLGRTDYVSVVLHALSHVRPLRDFFLAQRELLPVSPPTGWAAAAVTDIGPKNALVVKFGEVIRKMWSPHNFKSVVSPQEFLHVRSQGPSIAFIYLLIAFYHVPYILLSAFLCYALSQEVSVASNKRFSVASGQQEAADFLVWLLNALHRGLGGTNKRNSSIIYKTFHVKDFTLSFIGITPRYSLFCVCARRDYSRCIP